MPTILLRLGQLHHFLLFQRVHHVCQTSFAALWCSEGDADRRIAAIPRKVVWLRRRGRVCPVGVDVRAVTVL